jgi:small redox-active disulfide protein 2
MKIEIFGSGCPNCSKLEANTKQALDEAGMEAEVVKVTEMEVIVARGVMGTPAIAIDGEVKSSGKDLNVKQVKALLV